MKWMFLVIADHVPRIHARILQVLDNQRIPIHSFVVSTGAEWVTVHALIELDDDKVTRVRALLLRVECVHRIECFAASDGIRRTVALFDVSCDSSTQLPVLQAAAALGLLVVNVNHYSVVIEAVGSTQEIANFQGVFARHGVITTVAKATLGVVRDEDR